MLSVAAPPDFVAAYPLYTFLQKLALQSVPADQLDEAVDKLANRISTVPINQLAMQKIVVNQAMEASDMMQMQRMSMLFGGISRHSPEGLAFKARVDAVGWKQAVEEQDSGSFDWSGNKPF